MRACFFGTYNRFHPANRLLIRDLRAAGVTVVECHQPLWEKTRDKMANFFGAPALAANAARYLGCASRLALELKRAGDFDLFLAGFSGQLDVLLLRLLARGRTPIVFAPLMSVTETLVDDRRLFTASSPRGRLARLFDRLSLRAADIIIADTAAHKDYLQERLELAGRPIVVHYIGADESFYEPGIAGLPAELPRMVLFYGQYVPLHGTDVIVRAAAKLAGRDDLRFCLIGTGPQRQRAQSVARSLGAKISFEDWVDFTRLPRRVASASICLGIFGRGEKASMVIPTKVYQAAAAGKAVVTAETPAVKEVFAHGRNIYLCPPADAEALAAAVETVIDQTAVSRQIGEGAREIMASRLSPAAQGERLLRELVRVDSRLARGS